VKDASCRFHEKAVLSLISIRAYGTDGVLIDAFPGLRPGLFSFSHSGRVGGGGLNQPWIVKSGPQRLRNISELLLQNASAAKAHIIQVALCGMTEVMP
jgi:hypothetical protein